MLKETPKWLDEKDILAIALADHGMDAESNILALRRIINLQMVPSPLAWNPREVLELTRWDEPSEHDVENERRHQRRSFASTVLLIAHGDLDNNLYSSDDALIQLIFSLMRLGAPLDRHAISLLRWLIPLRPEDAYLDRLYCGMGLLWFGLNPSSGLSGSDLSALLDWIVNTEAVAHANWGGQGVFLTELRSHSQLYYKWQELAPMLNERARKFFATMASRVALITCRLTQTT